VARAEAELPPVLGVLVAPEVFLPARRR